MTVKIVAVDKQNPYGKLADAEIHFDEGLLTGLKLMGLAIWEGRGGTGRTVTFPARYYQVQGSRRAFPLLRPIADSAAQKPLREAVLQAYAEHEAQHADAEEQQVAATA